MTQIFIVHSEGDGPCAVRIRNDLETEGYIVWKETWDLTPGSISYPRMIETGIRGSAAMVVVWSSNAAQAEWVERKILFAQRLKKPIFPIVIDKTDLPITLINVQSIASEPSCASVVKQLLLHLPPPDSDDVLLVLLEQLTHEHIRERKEGIDRAAELLEKDKYREEILALLEDIARSDLIMGLREKAQALLDIEAKKEAPPVIREGESRHTFGAICPNGHITYFDKRRVCPDSGTFVRSIIQRAGVELDEIYLKCGEDDCDQEMIVHVDCEGYK